jgi:transcriptional regulator with XRE-family HTH domain
MKNKIIRTHVQMGPLLKDIRKSNNYTQIQLFEESGVLPKTISALENGNIKCTIESFINFIQACEYHIELVKNEDPNNSEVDW